LGKKLIRKLNKNITGVVGMSKIKEYADLCASKWGSGEFGDKALGRPDPFTVLSDETRLAITVLLCLKGPLTAKQIAEELDLSPSTVLGHLRRLREAIVIREVDVSERRYKRERYYDVDLVPYFMDEREEISRRIGKYIDILSQTGLAVFEKCLDELKDYFRETLAARHGMTLEKDEVKHMIWTQLIHGLDRYFSERGIYKPPLETTKRHFFYMGLKKPRWWR